MKKKILQIAAFSILALSISCREEIMEISSDNNSIVDQGMVKNGRLYFPNMESLSVTYSELKQGSLRAVQDYVDGIGLESLVPIITDENENEVVNKLRSRKIEYLKNYSPSSIKASVSDDEIYEDLDDLEEIIGDEVYASMLNENAEIQVGDNVYKYTDVGLFVTPVENHSNLEDYLEKRRISLSLLEPTVLQIKESYVLDKKPSELLSLADTNSKINYFISRFEAMPFDGSNGGPNGGYSGGSTYSPPAEPSIADVLQGIRIGEVRKPWLGNLFGTTWTTHDKYERRRRVKVKFYSQNLYLVYAVGCKVKHQFRGWTGFWRKEKADKLGIGINSISWKFSHAVNYGQNNVPREVYWLNGKMYKAANNTDYVNMGNSTMPTFPFSNNATVDAVIQFTTDVTGLTEQQLNKLFWDKAWKQANKLLTEQNKKLNRVAFVVDTFNSTYIQYYDISQIQYNQDVIERIFNWGIASPQFTYTFGGGTGNGLTVTSYKFNFLQPTAVAVSMYGIAYKNGGWHGVKLNSKNN